MISAAVLFLMAFIKGFPSLIFIFISSHGTDRLSSSYTTAKKRRPKQPAGLTSAQSRYRCCRPYRIRGGADEYALTLPVILEVGKNLSNAIRKDKQGQTFIEDMIPKMRHALYQDLGGPLSWRPRPHRFPYFEADEYSIFLNEVPIVRGKIFENALLTTKIQRRCVDTTSLSQQQKIRSANPPSGWIISIRKSFRKPASNFGSLLM